MSAILYAHTNPESDDEVTWQPLSEHLNNVAEMAASFAAEFGMAQWGRMMGLIHDSGKSSTAFQAMLRGDGAHVDHATAGAKIAIERYGLNGYYAAYGLVGHHGGQPNGIKKSVGCGCYGRTPLETRLNRKIEPYDRFFELVESGEIDLPTAEDLGMPMVPERRGCKENEMKSRIFSTYVLNRFLYSALVDADYLDTEAFMDSGASALRCKRSHKTMQELLEILEDHLSNLCKKDAPLNQARQKVLEDCLDAAVWEQGLFTLTVPTGGGKTLSSLAFALKHAIIHHMSRVIIAVPFVTVTEQTAQVLKEIFGPEAVLEHHSSFDSSDLDDEEALAHRLAAQNWDAPIIVTTNVQLLESLFANKPGKSRKVHNIARSVIILDEAQTLPDSLLVASLAMLEELVFSYKTSIVLCTATQPALDMRWPFGSEPREIISAPDVLRKAFDGRVRFEMRGELDIDELVDELSGFDQVLCVVGTRKGARKIYTELVAEAIRKGELGSKGDAADKGYYHLSAFMTSQHRSDVVESIRKRLLARDRCVVVSTQLVEAGVDIDFPVVFREMAGIDSLVQAAGRCNREGREGAGLVEIFEYTIDGERQKTTPWLEDMKDITRGLIEEGEGGDIPTLIRPFFEKRYRTEELDDKRVFERLTARAIVDEGFRIFPFEQVSLDYRIIDDDTVPLFIPYGTCGEQLLEEFLRSSIRAGFVVRLQRHSVSISPWLAGELKKAQAVLEIDSFLILRKELMNSFYRDDVGLLRPGEEEWEMLFF